MPLSKTRSRLRRMAAVVEAYTVMRPYYRRVLHTENDNLVCYWPLWEAAGSTAVDESGNSRDGTYNDPTLGQPGIGDGWSVPLFGP